MAITVNNLQSTASDTLLHTPANVTDPCLVVLVPSEDVGNNEPITGVLFGATSMTLEVVGQGILGSNSNDIAIAYLVNPGTTAQTITVTGGQHDRMGIVALTLDNVDQSSPVDVSDESFETTSIAVVPTSATTTNDNSFIVSGSTTGDAGASMSVVGATEILEFTPPSSKLAVGTSTQTPAGTYTHTWTSTVAGRTSSASIAFNLAIGGGSISVTGDTANYDYSGIVVSIDLTGEVIVVGETANYNHLGIDGMVDLTALITVTGQTANYDYDGILAEVIIQGDIIVTGNTANYDCSGVNATITLQGPVTVNPKNTISVKRNSNTVTVKRYSNTVTVKRKSNTIKVR